MRIGRTISVLLLAWAVSLSPLAMGFAGAGPTQAPAATMSQDVPDCDHHQHHGAPSGQTQKDSDHTTCPIGCTLCFVVANVAIPEVTYSVPVSTSLQPVYAGTPLSSLMGSPPFRPPRA
jgi:hypothetical protein